MIARSVIALAAVLCWASAADAASCTVSSSSVNFGTYNVFDSAPNDSTGTVTLNCNGGAKNVAVAISRGGAATFALRRMLKVAEQLRYNLYLDAARTIVWGDGSSGTQMQIEPNPPNNKDLSLTVFARVPATQDVSAGSYSDSITVTVNY